MKAEGQKRRKEERQKGEADEAQDGSYFKAGGSPSSQIFPKISQLSSYHLLKPVQKASKGV